MSMVYMMNYNLLYYQIGNFDFVTVHPYNIPKINMPFHIEYNVDHALIFNTSKSF